MEAILALVSEQMAAVLIGAIVAGGPFLLVFALQAFKAYAKTTPSKIDDELADALLRAAKRQGAKEAERAADGEGE